MVNDSYGTFISKTICEGPFKRNRECTDRFWVFTFYVFVIVWISISIHTFSNSDLNKLIVPTDSDGRKCGIDINVQDRPYLVFFDLTKCTNGICNTTQVCQTSCPNSYFIYDSDTKLNNSLEDIKKKLICQIDINTKLINDWNTLEYYITQGKCAKWYLKSKPIVKRCIPDNFIPAKFNTTVTNGQLNKASEIIMQIANFEKSLENIYHDVIVTRYPVLGFTALSGLAAFFYIILLRWLAKPFVYTSVFIICAFLVYFIYESSIQYSIQDSSYWLYVLIFCVILLSIVVLTTTYLHTKINLACQLIKEASKAVSCIWSSLFFPLISWISHVLVVIISVSVFLCLQTITKLNYQIYVQEMVPNTCICPSQLNYINNVSCDPNIFKSECHDINGGQCLSSGCYLSSVTVPKQVYIYHIINILAFLWFSFFVSAFEQMALATTFASWYWTFNKRNIASFTLIRSIWTTLRYHMGTLAFGSLIMWICDIIRFIIRPFTGSLQSNNTLGFQSMNCFRVLIDFLMSFLQYINRNAYIMCAIHGKNFCHSAKNAFNLISRNIIRVVCITNVTDWLLRIAKYFIIVLSVGLTLGYYSNFGSDIINDYKVPLAMVFLGSYLLTTAFFKVHRAAVDTLFICFLEDSECNNGSVEKPYYMSMRLKQLLQK